MTGMELLKRSSVFLRFKTAILERALETRFGKSSAFLAVVCGLAITTLLSVTAHAGVFVSADGRTDTYLLFHEGDVLYEVPDCAHSKFGPHITQQYDDELEEYVFAFHLHTALDNDRCIVFDRQRTEVATFRSKALEGDIRTYQWRFKLKEEFLPSTFWNHVFQIRAIDPIPGGSPIFTFSTLSGETEELLFYQDVGNGMQVLFRAPLAEFKGHWIDAYVRAKFSRSGFMEVRLESALDNRVLLEWKEDDINLWPSDITLFTLPKWGNYRSLEGDGPLQNEIVLFDDFCVAEEGESCEGMKMLDETGFQVVPTAYQLSTEVSIDPFPTDQAISESNIVDFLRQMLSATNGGRHAVRPSSEVPVIERDTESTDLNDAPMSPSNTISKRRPVLNPFAGPRTSSFPGQRSCESDEKRSFRNQSDLRDRRGSLCE